MANLHVNGWDTGREVTHQGTVEFTSDMADTLNKFFAAYEAEGVVTVEVTNRGLWLRNPHTGGRQFLGLARL